MWAARLVPGLLVLQLALAQDLSDCAWHPDPEMAELQCHLKTLQTGPAVIPQVNICVENFLQCSN